MKLRPDTDTVEVPTEFYRPFPGYTDDAGPEPDMRLDQLANPEPDPLDEIVEPEPEHGNELPTDDAAAVPYGQSSPPPTGTAGLPDRLPNDAQTRTIFVGDVPTPILSEDPQRTSWCVYVAGSSAASIRFALGRHAREDAEQAGHSVELGAADGPIRGTNTGPAAAVSATPGTVATVVVLTERDTRR